MKTMNLCGKCERELALKPWRVLPVRMACEHCGRKCFLTVCEVKG